MKIENLQILGDIEANTIELVVLKAKIRKEIQTNEKATRSKTLIKDLDIWKVPLVRYLEPFLKWTIAGLIQRDKRTRKLITMHKVLHPKEDIENLLV